MKGRTLCTVVWSGNTTIVEGFMLLCVFFFRIFSCTHRLRDSWQWNLPHQTLVQFDVFVEGDLFVIPQSLALTRPQKDLLLSSSQPNDCWFHQLQVQAGHEETTTSQLVERKKDILTSDTPQYSAEPFNCQRETTGLEKKIIHTRPGTPLSGVIQQ